VFSPKIGWVALMPKALAIQINRQFTGGGIMQVELLTDLRSAERHDMLVPLTRI